MYCEFYDFSEKPFTVTPNPRFIFLSKNHQEAFAHLLYGIDNHAGFIELTGEIGTGKTTVLRTLLSQLDETAYRTALIFNPCLSATELLRSINREYGLPGDGLSNAGLLQELNRFLLREKAAGRTVVLVVDEAQNLEPPVLEQIRLISNLETDTDKLIQIVLAGQPEFARLLEKPELRQLSQRITVRYHLKPMDFPDAGAYIRHRLSMAGCGLGVHFTPAALRRIYRYSGGIPRIINILCDRVLLVGYAEGCREISRQLVNSAIREIRSEMNVRWSGLWMRTAAVCLAALVLPSFFYIVARQEHLRWPFSHTVAIDDNAASAGSEPAAVSETVKRGLSGLGEKQSFLESFNALAIKWSVQPVRIYSGANPALELKNLARRRGLNVTEVKGSMSALMRMDSPALLEFRLPGNGGKRYLALTGVKNGRLLIEPSLIGRTSVSPGELKAFWSGRAYLLWKSSPQITALPAPGAKGPEVVSLQKMLARKGFYKGSQSGTYDGKTEVAVKAFQRAHGLEPDGKPGGKTLFLLYRGEGGVSGPRLQRSEGEKNG